LVSLGVLSWLLLLGTSSAGAFTGVMQNDSFTSASAFTCNQGWALGESFASAFAAPVPRYPIKITSVQLMICGSAQDTLAVSLYADSLDGTASPDGDPLTSSSYEVTPSSTALTELDLSAADVILSSGGLRVAVSPAGSDPPDIGLGLDNDGGTSQRNFIYAEGNWGFAPSFGVINDFILRANYVGQSIDATVRRSGNDDPLGDNVYNTSGAGQTRKWSAIRGKTRSFVVELQNEGPAQAALAVQGCAKSKGFKVKYFDGAANVTPQVVAGSYHRNLDAAGSRSLRLAITPKDDAKVGQTKSCKVGASTPANADVIKAQLKVKRG
jgi:hypothetical protein